MTRREWHGIVAQLADEYGYTVSVSRNNHLRLSKPGRPMIFTSSTPSDHRVARNLRAELRRGERAA